MPRRWTGCILLAGLLGGTTASAEEAPAPVFQGHPYLTLYTKEVSGEGSAVRLGNGRFAVAGGSSMAAFYTRWFSILGGAQGSYELKSGRQVYDTRAVLRFIWPEPLLGRVFFYGGVGMTVFFFEEQAKSSQFVRGLGPIAAGGSGCSSPTSSDSGQKCAITGLFLARPT